MIQLANTPYWIDVAPDGAGWVLLRHTPGKAGKGSVTENLGRFTSPRHVLQQRKVKLPKEGIAYLQGLVDAMDGGDAALDHFPSGDMGPNA